MIERTFVKEHIKEFLIDEYFKKELSRAGYSHCYIRKTPIGTKIIIYAEKPGFVIGRRGSRIRELTETLAKEFGVEKPQIDVKPVENPDLDAQVVAQKVAQSLERGMHFRRVGHTAVRRVMNAGAKGVIVIISGKLTGERARTEKFMAGYMKHCGEPAEELVDKGSAIAKTKPGVIGVTVKIMRPDVLLPDEIIIKDTEVEHVVEEE
ncbi:ribosomal protein S3 [Methanocaldococcus vulcanius M7]|uniref:Small ribosomal subunit protein uS3 n=1 Tax=Methanocaldococcus vulcanius (strain ATCC 700851 / DSM 12094 / M7) TaxID=579137 RepID=C9REU1_METVM|nr:30S ribosomal protein S3 [Methanocaldococcus vulcanius]ACX72093.1 ribosomal protein S3 [Methanocaldococcus vulcanius M7]